MAFWLMLDVLFLLFVICSWFGYDEKNKYIVWLMVLVLVLVSGFRYMIGGDYSEYMGWFYYAEIGTIYPEISFSILATVLRENNINYQALFLIYSIITLVLFRRGIAYYLPSRKYQILSIFFFCVAMAVGFWESMNTIREMSAIVIALYGSRYMFERKLKLYFMWIVFATLFHYSAVVMMLIYFIPKYFSKRMYYIAWSFSGVILSAFHLENIIVFLNDNYSLSKGVSYIGTDNKMGIGIVLSFFLYTIYIKFFDAEKMKEKFVASMYLYGIIVYFAFSSVGTIGSRLSHYFFIYQFIMMPVIIKNVNLHIMYKRMMILAVCVSLIGIHMIFLHKITVEDIKNYRASAGNIDYQYNFDFTK